MAPRYFLIAPDVRVCLLDDDAIVFNPFSWETHLLNPAAALTLQLIASGPCTEARVCEVLAEVLGDGERPQAAEHARRLLRELLDLRLLLEQANDPDASR